MAEKFTYALRDPSIHHCPDCTHLSHLTYHPFHYGAAAMRCPILQMRLENMRKLRATTVGLGVASHPRLRTMNARVPTPYTHRVDACTLR